VPPALPEREELIAFTDECRKVDPNPRVIDGYIDDIEVPRRVRLYPVRVRCYACRRFFGFEVVDRLYCSWACAGRPEPEFPLWPTGPAGPKVPRECKLGLTGRRSSTFKRRFRSLQAALAAAEASPVSGLDVYPCSYCGFFHVGHPRDP
jgi:hypothetical protein